jgi:hypothetical protein
LSRQAKSNIMILFGGLGNQLHQLAVGCLISNSSAVELDAITGNPRLFNNRVAIASYILPPEVAISLHSSQNVRKWFVLNLLKVSAKRSENYLFDKFLLAIKKVLSVMKFRGRSIFIAHGVGFDPRVNPLLVNRVLIGTFHSYKWVNQPNVLKQMRSLKMLNEPIWLTNLKASTEFSRPIIVHIRRGDYLAIRELGFLHEEYYRSGINLLASKYPEKPIWIFSDQLDGITKYIPSEFTDRIKIINFDQDDAVANLEAMRLGDAYVLSNSTYSWWAAMLSISMKPEVVCPSRWFRSKANPSMYIPGSWIQISA